MKKTLSLFMSIMLILTMTFSLVQAAAVQIRPCNVFLDMKSASTVSVSASSPGKISLDGVQSEVLGIARRGSGANTAVASYNGYSNVIKQSKLNTSNLYIDFYALDAGGNRVAASDGAIKIEGKFLADNVLNQAYWQFQPGNKSVSLGADNILPNIWYDVEITLDLDTTSDNITYSFVPELTGDSSGEIASYTLSGTSSYSNGSFENVRSVMSCKDQNNAIYWADIKMTHILPSYSKAAITSVGSSGEVAFNQNNVLFTLSDKIPGLSIEHISITNANGQEAAISSAAISSDGTAVNIISQNPLPAWTQYTLTISAEAWGKGSVQIEDETESEVTAITAEFHTPAASFDMKDPLFTLSDGILCVDTTLINTSGTSEDVTLVIAIYGADGRIKSVNPTSFVNFEAAYPGEDKHIEAPISEGESAKLIAINGWTKRTALFGKYWTISYDELNQ